VVVTVQMHFSLASLMSGLLSELYFNKFLPFGKSLGTNLDRAKLSVSRWFLQW